VSNITIEDINIFSISVKLTILAFVSSFNLFKLKVIDNPTNYDKFIGSTLQLGKFTDFEDSPFNFISIKNVTHYFLPLALLLATKR
jgi:hypothetical protein